MKQAPSMGRLLSTGTNLVETNLYFCKAIYMCTVNVFCHKNPGEDSPEGQKLLSNMSSATYLRFCIAVVSGKKHAAWWIVERNLQRQKTQLTYKRWVVLTTHPSWTDIRDRQQGYMHVSYRQHPSGKGLPYVSLVFYNLWLVTPAFVINILSRTRLAMSKGTACAYSIIMHGQLPMYFVVQSSEWLIGANRHINPAFTSPITDIGHLLPKALDVRNSKE